MAMLLLAQPAGPFSRGQDTNLRKLFPGC